MILSGTEGIRKARQTTERPRPIGRIVEHDPDTCGLEYGGHLYCPACETAARRAEQREWQAAELKIEYLSGIAKSLRSDGVDVETALARANTINSTLGDPLPADAVQSAVQDVFRSPRPLGLSPLSEHEARRFVLTLRARPRFAAAVREALQTTGGR